MRLVGWLVVVVCMYVRNSFAINVDLAFVVIVVVFVFCVCFVLFVLFCLFVCLFVCLLFVLFVCLLLFCFKLQNSRVQSANAV